MSLSLERLTCVRAEMGCGMLYVDEMKKKYRVMDDNASSGHNGIFRIITQHSAGVRRPFSGELQ